MKRFLLPVLGVLALHVSIGCAPQTAFRRSALVPSPRGEVLTTPMRGDVQVAGTVSHTDSDRELLPEIGDPALHVARTQIAGFMRFRAGEHVSLGAEATWSHLELASASAHGTPPVTGEHVWGLGPNVSVFFGSKGSRVSFGFTGALTIHSVPYTIWERTTSPGLGDWGFDPADHRVAAEGSDLLVLTRLSGALNYAITDQVALHTGLSFQNHVLNIGFDDQERDGSTLTASDLGFVHYLGASLSLDEGFFAAAQFYLPIGYEQLHGVQMGGSVTIGADLQ